MQGHIYRGDAENAATTRREAQEIVTATSAPLRLCVETVSLLNAETETQKPGSKKFYCLSLRPLRLCGETGLACNVLD